MYSIFLNRKTGFSSDSDFKIYDLKGKLFYGSDFTNTIKKGKVLYFNLPLGSYEVSGKITKLSKPVPHKKIHLPPPERMIPKKRFKILFGVNPNKCSVFWKRRVILFDNSFKEEPKYVVFDIFFHELGHRYYKTEHLADLFATKKMLAYGFNPSQIGRSLINTLSEKSNYRKVLKVNSLLGKDSEVDNLVKMVPTKNNESLRVQSIIDYFRNKTKPIRLKRQKKRRLSNGKKVILPVFKRKAVIPPMKVDAPIKTAVIPPMKVDKPVMKVPTKIVEISEFNELLPFKQPMILALHSKNKYKLGMTFPQVVTTFYKTFVLKQ